MNTIYNFLTQSNVFTFFVISLAVALAIDVIAVVEEQSTSRDRWRVWARIWLISQVIAVVITIGLGVLQIGIYFGYLPDKM